MYRTQIAPGTKGPYGTGIVQWDKKAFFLRIKNNWSACVKQFSYRTVQYGTVLYRTTSNYYYDIGIFGIATDRYYKDCTVSNVRTYLGIIIVKCPAFAPSGLLPGNEILESTYVHIIPKG